MFMFWIFLIRKESKFWLGGYDIFVFLIFIGVVFVDFCDFVFIVFVEILDFGNYEIIENIFIGIYIYDIWVFGFVKI